VEVLRKNLEDWFNDAMDRFSGWYKRWTQAVSLGVAALLVCVGNVDTIRLGNRLLHDEALRVSIITAAEQAVQKKDNTKELLDQANQLGVPTGLVFSLGDRSFEPWIDPIGGECHYRKVVRPFHLHSSGIDGCALLVRSAQQIREHPFRWKAA